MEKNKASRVKQIAIVEDDEGMRSMLVEYLRKYFQVFAFSNPVEFLENKKSPLGQFSLVISDIKMPLMNGYELLKKLKTSASAPPVILISANIAGTEKERAIDCGAQAFLTKPFALKELRELAESLAKDSGQVAV